jgi:hypothetical protein
LLNLHRSMSAVISYSLMGGFDWRHGQASQMLSAAPVSGWTLMWVDKNTQNEAAKTDNGDLLSSTCQYPSCHDRDKMEMFSAGGHRQGLWNGLRVLLS